MQEPKTLTRTIGIINGKLNTENYKIVIGKSPIETHIFCNGKELTNVTDLSINLSIKGLTMTITQVII